MSSRSLSVGAGECCAESGVFRSHGQFSILSPPLLLLPQEEVGEERKLAPRREGLIRPEGEKQD